MSKMNEKYPYEQRGLVEISRPFTYSFRYSPNGWANHTLNDTTGEYSLESDWGSYQHRWHIGALGTDKSGRTYTLTEFISRAGVHYIADKFSYNSQPDLKDVVDPLATVNAIQEALKEEGYKAAALRSLVGHALRWSRSCDADIDAYYRDDDFEELREAMKGREISEYIRHDKSPRYYCLVEFILPHFQKYLRAHLKKAKEVDACSVEE